MSSISDLGSIQQIVKALAQTIDTKQDFQLGADQFASMLADLLGSPSAAVSSASAAAPAMATSVAPLPVTVSIGRSPAMGGFEATRIADRMDTSPKYEFARWIQDNAAAPTTDNLRVFVESHPDWEMRGSDQLRMKQSALDLRSPGKQTVWQDVIFDVNGPGASWQFVNAE
jgi:hypothetical protein